MLRSILTGMSNSLLILLGMSDLLILPSTFQIGNARRLNRDSLSIPPDKSLYIREKDCGFSDSTRLQVPYRPWLSSAGKPKEEKLTRLEVRQTMAWVLSRNT